MRGGQPRAKLDLIAPAEAVKQVELSGGEGEPPVLVLPEESDHPAAERLKVSRRGGAALHERTRATLGADPPGQHDLVQILPHALAQIRQLGLLEQPRRSSKTPSTYASGAPGLTMPERGLPPSSRSSAWASTVLPAPVSPVIAVSPSPGRSSALSIRSRFSMRSSSSTAQVYQRDPTERALSHRVIQLIRDADTTNAAITSLG